MTDFRWFTLLVRTVGLLFVGFGGAAVFDAVASILAYVPYLQSTGGYPGQPGPGWQIASSAAWLVGYGGQTGFGLYLLFRGHRVIGFCLRDLADRCPACAYPVRGLKAERCPECGLAVPNHLRDAPAASTT